jgi:neutral ceramidase
MFGFGLYEHRAQGVETPLFAKALIIEDESKNKVAIVLCDIAIITDSLKKEVLKKLQEKNIFDFNNENLLLSANHTHSAAGGYAHYPFYNFSNGGFHPPVLEKYAESSANAIVEANSKLVPVTLSVHKGRFELEKPVSFNRSLKAYNANKDIEFVPVGSEHLATDREMVLLKIEDENKKILGCINWFGVHTTSCGNDHYKICSDNKGYASAFHEEKYLKDNPDFISIFAQKPCGDITPLTHNLWIEHRAKKLKDPDYVHAAANGKLQFEKADELLNKKPDFILSGSIDTILAHSDFTRIKIVDPVTNEQKQITGTFLSVLAGMVAYT